MKRVPNFWTSVENCKLLEICTAQMRSIITGCSGTIFVKDREAMEAISYSIIKHGFGDFKRIDLENI